MSKLINSRSNWLSSDKISPYVLAGILVLAFSIRLIGLDKGIWLDEAFTIQMISKANLLEMLQNLRGDVHPPLYYVLLYFWLKITNSEESLRLFSVLFATALAFFFASRVIAKPEKLSGYIGLTLSLTVAMSTKLIGVMLLAPIFLFVVMSKMRISRISCQF